MNYRSEIKFVYIHIYIERDRERWRESHSQQAYRSRYLVCRPSMPAIKSSCQCLVFCACDDAEEVKKAERVCFTGIHTRKVQRIARGAGGKGPRQKSSKSVKLFFDTFRQFSRRAKNVKNRQKVSKKFSTLFDKFRAAPFFRPLLQSAER